MTTQDVGTLAATRHGLHLLAFHVLSPTRHAAEGRMGLEATPDGFGTPWFGEAADRRRVRVASSRQGVELVVESHGETRSTRPADLDAACAFVGIAFRPVWFDDFRDPPAVPDPHEPLVLDPDAAQALADWFALGTRVLRRLTDGAGDLDPASVTLWPEHFDVATELGVEADGARASCGASPGDADHPSPYLYVGPWERRERTDPYWNDPSFGGASLARDDVMAAADPDGAARDFLWRGVDLLHRGAAHGG